MRTLLFTLTFLVASPVLAASPKHPDFHQQETAQDTHREAWRQWLLERRAQQMERLAAYRDAGEFPHNDSSPTIANLLVDDSGTYCAMAHLVVQDGLEKVIRKEARRDNALRFANVHDGPLNDWLLTSGLTREEASYVQVPDMPVYFEPELLEPEPPPILVEAERMRIRAHFDVALLLLAENTDASIDLALQRLGDRVASPPPTEQVALR